MPDEKSSGIFWYIRHIYRIERGEKMCQKEIMYLGLFYQDVREQNAGYLKADKKGDIFCLELQVKKLPGTVTGNFPIRLQSETGWREAGMLIIKDGNGKWNGSAAEQILRAEVILSDTNRIKGESRSIAVNNAREEKREETQYMTEKREESSYMARKPEKRPPTERQREEAPRMAERPEERRRMESQWEEVPRMAERHEEKPRMESQWEEAPHMEERSEEKPRAERQHEERPHMADECKEWSFMKKQREEKPFTAEEREERARMAEQRENRPPMTEPHEKGPFIENRLFQKTLTKAECLPTGRQEHMPLYENKWEQLLTTYEQIHPYGDNRIYIKLEPKDFIVLRENYQHLVNNSFLLHGFYNYRYLILGREKDFYLGVPGVFYEREKMVALMFGFEAFECEGGGAEEGKFGYYLRKVEL